MFPHRQRPQFTAYFESLVLHLPPPLIGRILFAIQKSDGRLTVALCWRYLSSQAVASQVLSTEMSLTTVFGMGTGGPSS